MKKQHEIFSYKNIIYNVNLPNEYMEMQLLISLHITEWWE